MIVWKVVVRNIKRNGFESCIVFGKARVSYKIGKWARAPRWLAKREYHLFAFARFKDAVRFINKRQDASISWAEVYKAEAKSVTKKLPGYLSIGSLYEGFIQSSCAEFPRGTVMCRQIKLLNKDAWQRYINTVLENPQQT